MSPKPDFPPLQDAFDGKQTGLEERLHRSAASFLYPPTPDLAAKIRQRLTHRSIIIRQHRHRRAAFTLGIVLLIVMAGVMVSPVRARVLDWIRVGAVRIFLTMPTPTVSLPAPTGVETRTGVETSTVTSEMLQSVLDLAGETSLSDAEEQAGFPILLPAFPADLNQPDLVFLQRNDRPAVILVWMDPDHPGQVLMSLTEAPSGSFIFEKYVPKSIQETQVNGQPAVWIEGEYPLVTRSGDITMTRLVNQGHTLVWTYDELTFRLEMDVDLDRAVQIAESLR